MYYLQIKDILTDEPVSKVYECPTENKAEKLYAALCLKANLDKYYIDKWWTNKL